MKKYKVMKAIKIGIGSCVSVLIAQTIGLEYATTAGTITFLTIRNTTRDTWTLSANRLISFVVSVFFISFVWNGVDNQSVGFGIFMFIICFLSYEYSWEDAISVNAVIGSHVLLLEQQISVSLFLNELGLLIIGTMVAIIMNLYMPDRVKDIQNDIDYIELELSEILKSMSTHLLKMDRLRSDKIQLLELINYIENSNEKAFEDINNKLYSQSRYYVEYLNMRKNQCIILIHLYGSIQLVQNQCEYMKQVAKVMTEISDSLKDTESIKKLIEKINIFIITTQQSDLPINHKEFMSKVHVLHILYQLQELLQIKQEFLNMLTEEELIIYWNKAYI